ncbi:MAG: N-acetyltransferase [Candidatus Moranbacteria bacterium]|nr:N-acetyltransferase [Candidatus Moranbacteria bacterium]
MEIKRELIKQYIVNFALPEDAQKIREVWYRAWLSTYPSKEYGITREEIKEKLQELLSKKALKKYAESIRNPQPGQYLIVARENGKIFGMCSARRMSDKNTLQALYVDPQFQGMGMGMALWEKARQCFDPKNKTFSNVAFYNKKGIRFWKKVGFVETGKQGIHEKTKLRFGIKIPVMGIVRPEEER